MAGGKMTEREIADAVESNRLGGLHQKAIKERESVLDAITVYLKETKRRRAAPTRAYQYIGFRASKLRQLMAAFEDAQDAEDETEHNWLHRDNAAKSCAYCEAGLILAAYVAGDEDRYDVEADTIISPIGQAFEQDEMREIIAEHVRGRHAEAMFDDCPPCNDERDAA